MERRDTALEVRAKGKCLTGYASVFDTEAMINGGREVIRPGAFARSLAESEDILALADHDATRVLGRTRSKTLRLSEDSMGLHFELDVPDTQTGRDMVELVKRGDAGGMSFGFTIIDDEHHYDLREIREVQLFEISIVSAFPAYPTTSVEARGKALSRPLLRAAQRRLRIVEGQGS
jgi:HK97 family phage prohead protease